MKLSRGWIFPVFSRSPSLNSEKGYFYGCTQVNKSDEHSVFLRNLSFETNGRFKCVISAEGTFQTLENAKDIEVIGEHHPFPSELPHISYLLTMLTF